MTCNEIKRFLPALSLLVSSSAMPWGDASAATAAAIPTKIVAQNNVAGGSAGPNVVETQVPNSGDNYLNDTLFWDRYIGLKENLNDSDPTICISPRTRLMGASSSYDTVTVIPDGAKPADGATKSKQYLEVQLGAPRSLFGGGPTSASKAAILRCPTIPTAVQQKTLQPDQIAYLDVVDLPKAYRAGFDFGVLTVPFKIQLSGKHSFSGSASVGAYLGYRIPWPESGLVFSPILFAGASNISTSATTASGTTSQTVAGLSYGIGVITTVKDSLQVGLVFGADHVDSAQPYAYNDKPWLSFEIGYSFTK